MRIMLFATWVLAVWAIAAIATAVTLNLVARIARYRHYRSMYPYANRGRVWRHVRDR